MDKTSTPSFGDQGRHLWVAYRQWKGRPFFDSVLLNIALTWWIFDEPLHLSLPLVLAYLGFAAFWPIMLYLFRFKFLLKGETSDQMQVIPLKSLGFIFLWMLVMLPSGWVFWSAARWLSGRSG